MVHYIYYFLWCRSIRISFIVIMRMELASCGDLILNSNTNYIILCNCACSNNDFFFVMPALMVVLVMVCSSFVGSSRYGFPRLNNIVCGFFLLFNSSCLSSYVEIGAVQAGQFIHLYLLYWT